mgnify:FL=1
MEIIIGIVCLVVGAAVGSYIGNQKGQKTERNSLISYQNDHPPLTEETLRLIIEQLRLKPSREIITQILERPSERTLYQAKGKETIKRNLPEKP